MPTLLHTKIVRRACSACSDHVIAYHRVPLHWRIALIFLAISSGVISPKAAALTSIDRHDQYLLTAIYKGERIAELLPAYLPPEDAAVPADTLPPLVLAKDLLIALGLHPTTDEDGTLSGSVEPAGGSFLIRPTGEFQINGRTTHFDQGEFALIDGELYLAPSVFGHILPVKVTINRREQHLIVEGAGPLPLDIERDREMARLRLRQSRKQVTIPLTPLPYRLVGPPAGDLRIDVLRAASGRLDYTYDAALVGELGFTTTRLFLQGGRRSSISDARLTFGRESQGGGILGSTNLTSVHFGDVSLPNSRLVGSASGRGILLDAYPIDRPDSIDSSTIEGDGPSGWDVELYRQGQLLDFGTVDAEGRYRFDDVPLFYGENEFTLRFISPSGEVRETARLLNVGAGMAPPGKLYWRVFAGQNEARLLDFVLPTPGRFHDHSGIYSISADLGVVRWLTVNVQASRLPEDYRQKGHVASSFGGGLRVGFPHGYVEAELGWQPRNSFSTSGGRAWSLTTLMRLGGISISGRHSTYRDFLSRRALRGSSPVRYHSEIRATSAIPVRGGSLGVTLHGARWQLTDGTSDNRLQAEARFSHGPVFVTSGIERWKLSGGPAKRNERRTDLTTTVSANLSPRLRISAYGRYDFEQSGFQEVRISGHYFFDEHSTASFAVSRGASSVGNSGTSASVGLTHRLGPVWLNVTALRYPDGNLMLSTGLQVSFGLDGSGRPHLGSIPLANRGRAEVLVFMDRDGDGQFDSDVDQIMPDAQVLVNGRGAKEWLTDQAGRVLLDGLGPNAPVLIDIHPESIGDPFLRPSTGPFRFQPRAGALFRAELPLVDTGSISGKLRIERDGRTLEGGGTSISLLRVAALDQEQGGQNPAQLVDAVRSLPDGTFRFELVPPGRYRLRACVQDAAKVCRDLEQDLTINVTAEALDQEGIEFKIVWPYP